MIKKINVLSTFHGLGAASVALKRLGIPISRVNMYVSEIDAYCIMVVKKRFPDTIFLGDIRNIKGEDLPRIDIMFGGSPCQNLSGAGNKDGMSTETGDKMLSYASYKKYMKKNKKMTESSLFYEFIRLKNEVKPPYFLFENVKMSKFWEDVISWELGVRPLKINSQLVSAQHRERWYWTNIPGASIPRDKNIKLGDVIPGAITGWGKRNRSTDKLKPNGKKVWNPTITTNEDGKSYCITTGKTMCHKIVMKDKSVRFLTVDEAELLQTLPKGYTKVGRITDTARWKMVGNSWTVDVIVHLLKPIKNILLGKKKI